MSEDTGFQQDSFDHRDRYYRAAPGIQPKTSVNLRKDHSGDFGTVYDQGRTKSCTANAATACYWYEEKSGRLKDVWGAAGPSRMFVYWLARGGYLRDDGEIPDVKNVGSNSRDAMKGIAKCGVCAEDDCPFPNQDQIVNQIVSKNPNIQEGQPLNDAYEAEITRIVTTKPSAKAFSNAAPHSEAFYYRLDPDRPDAQDSKVTTAQKDQIGARLLKDLKTCLTEGYPVAFGYWNYLPNDAGRWQTKENDLTVLTDVWDPNGAKFPRHTFPDDLPEALKPGATGGHSVLAIGYDDNWGPNRTGAVLIQNSWGPGWSKGGLFWMPYNWITDFAASNDFWTIRTRPIDGKPLLWEEVQGKLGPSDR